MKGNSPALLSEGVFCFMGLKCSQARVLH